MLSTTKTLNSVLIITTFVSCLVGCVVTHKHQNPPPTAPTYITDQELANSVQYKLDHNRSIRAHTILVTSLNGVVTLNGSVPNQQTLQTVENIAASTAGVQAVKSRLVVGS